MTREGKVLAAVAVLAALAAVVWADGMAAGAALFAVGVVAVAGQREPEPVPLTLETARSGQRIKRRLTGEEAVLAEVDGRGLVKIVRGEIAAYAGDQSRWGIVIPPRPDFGTGPAGGSVAEEFAQAAWDRLYAHLPGALYARTVSLLGEVTPPPPEEAHAVGGAFSASAGETMPKACGCGDALCSGVDDQEHHQCGGPRDREIGASVQLDDEIYRRGVEWSKSLRPTGPRNAEERALASVLIRHAHERIAPMNTTSPRTADREINRLAEELANARAALSQETADRQAYEYGHERMSERLSEVEAERDEARARLESETAGLAELASRHYEAWSKTRAEADRMRPVVEAMRQSQREHGYLGSQAVVDALDAFERAEAQAGGSS